VCGKEKNLEDLFNDPVSVANPEERAVRMAEAKRARIRELGR